MRVDRATAATKGLDLRNGLPRLLIGNLAEDNMLAIEPRGHNGGDEELGAVPIGKLSASVLVGKGRRKDTKKTHVLGPALAMERIPGLVCL